MRTTSALRTVRTAGRFAQMLERMYRKAERLEKIDASVPYELEKNFRDFVDALRMLAEDVFPTCVEVSEYRCPELPGTICHTFEFETLRVLYFVSNNEVIVFDGGFGKQFCEPILLTTLEADLIVH